MKLKLDSGSVYIKEGENEVVLECATEQEALALLYNLFRYARGVKVYKLKDGPEADARYSRAIAGTEAGTCENL